MLKLVTYLRTSLLKNQVILVVILALIYNCALVTNHVSDLS